LTTYARTSDPLARHPARLFRRLAVLVVLLAAALAVGAPASFAKRPVSCGQQVINDWEDGQIDRSYPVHCYQDALKLVPADAREYSTLPVDIERALQAAMANGMVPGHQVGNPFGAKYQQAVVYASAVSRVAQPYNHRDEIALPQSDATPLKTGSVGCIIAGCGGSVSGLPLPLLILGGVAILLLLAGVAGMVMRRMQDRRLPPPGNA
jgi:hypothetical protein